MTDHEQVAQLIRMLGSDPDACADVVIRYLTGGQRQAAKVRKQRSRLKPKQQVSVENNSVRSRDNSCDQERDISPPAPLPFSPPHTPPLEPFPSSTPLESAPRAKSPSPPAPAASPTVLEFRCNGVQAVWHLTAAQVAEWAPVYPGLDVLAECRKANAWLGAQPAGKRKTAGGMTRFLVAWLGRANDHQPRGSPVSLFPQQRQLVANPYRKV